MGKAKDMPTTPQMMAATTIKQSRSASELLQDASAPAANVDGVSRRRSRSSSSFNSPSTYRAKPAPSEDPESDDFFAPITDSNTWHSVPLAFAVLPAVGGVLWDGGSAFVADVMLLLLLAVFLHWLVKFPWEWYHSSQRLLPTIPHGEEPAAAAVPIVDPARVAAEKEMRRNEMLALTACFAGPLLGGWMLHAVRSQLSRPSEGLVSNFNLTVFVLAAELRPVAQVVKLMRARTLHLQRMVHRLPRSRVEDVERRVEGLAEEVRELAALAKRAVERDPDLDALNRAVRRYEKREVLHSAQTESRILEINNRLNDVITLTAAAQRKQAQHTFAALLLDWACGFVLAPLSLTWKIMCLPAKAVELVTGAGEAGAGAGGSVAGGRGGGKRRLKA